MRTLAKLAVLALIYAWSLPAHAQNQSNQFNNGATGQPQSFLGGAGQGQTGGRGAGQNGFGNRAGQQGPGQRNQQHEGMVGRDAGDIRENFRNLSGRERRRASFDLLVDNLNEMRESRRRWRSRQRQPPVVRIQLRPSFDFPRPSSVAISSGLQRRLDAMPTPAGTDRPQIELNDRTATLRGSVSSDHQRALLARLVSLEPGVSQVENLLTVKASLILKSP